MDSPDVGGRVLRKACTLKVLVIHFNYSSVYVDPKLPNLSLSPYFPSGIFYSLSL